jgi:2-polyprenyl-3-methyl-5-hydroxy-6-metoxy-1,4-benzoquinol methylase|tara:strand:+ start:506 stop:1180 length:675 start_codon:yes stop_codon:yes gene_type:complete
LDKKQFWENKILKWESRRYGNKDDSSGPISFFRKKTGSSLQYRMQAATKILSPYLAGKKVLDIGCGSGIFFRNFLQNTDIEHYVGIDLSERAIICAKDISTHNGYSNKTTFLTGNILNMDFPPFDIVVALGVLDWLKEDEIDLLFKKLLPCKFLFSISEKRMSFARVLHSLYVNISYGWKTGQYVPRYYTVEQITKIARKNGCRNVQVFRDKRLEFGTLIYHLE